MWIVFRRIALGGGLAAMVATAAAVPAPASVPRAQSHPLLAGLPQVSLGGPCLRSGHAYLRARIRGAVRVDVDLHGSGLTCQGEPRLDGSGIRMGFEGRAGNAGRVRMIFGIDGAREGRAGRELPTNLTVFFEDKKQLFATQGGGNCTVDRLTQEPVNASGAPTQPRSAVARTPMKASAARRTKPGVYRVVAHGFCIAPANDLSGRRRILVTTFDFAGRVDFDAQ